METSTLGKNRWLYISLALIVCLELLLISYNYTKPTNTDGISWTHQPRLVLPEYLQQQNYVFFNLTARFKPANLHIYNNYSSNLTLHCASELWKLYRDPLVADPWQKGKSKSSSGESDVLSVSKRPFVQILFTGDSHMRYIFAGLVRRIASSRVKYRIASYPEGKWVDVMTIRKLHKVRESYHEAIHLDHPLKLTFRSDTYLEKLPQLLKEWLAGNRTRPNVLFVGIAYHYMLDSREIYQKTGEEVASMYFHHHMKFLAPLLDEFGKTTPTIFKLADHVRRKDFNVFDNSNVDYYNNISRSVLSGTHVTLMDSTHPLADLYIEECRVRFKDTPKTGVWLCKDEMHFGHIIVDQYVDMILNALCNGVIY